MIRNKRKESNCPQVVTEHTEHAIVGKIIGNSVMGYDLSTMVFPYDYDLHVTDDNNSTISNTFTWNTVSDLIVDLNNVLSSMGNSTTFTYSLVNGVLVIYVINSVAYNLQIGIRQQVTGTWITGNSPDPNNDGITGLPPYPIVIEDINNGKSCELIRILPDTFNPTTDKVLFKKIGGNSVPSNYTPYGYGNTISGAFPPATNATNLYMFAFYGIVANAGVTSISIETLAVPFTGSENGILLIPNLAQVQTALDTVLIGMGYAANDAIITVMNDGEIVIWYSPAFSANVVNGDYIHFYGGGVSTPGNYIKVDFVNVLSYTKGDINLPIQGSGGIKYGTIPQQLTIPRPILSLRTFQEPQHHRLTSGGAPTFNDNNIKLIIKYPEGYSEFEKLVALGNIRLQLQHFDGKCGMKHKDIGGNVTNKVNLEIAPKFCPHRNGTLDVGDYIFGGDCRDSGGNLYPDRDTMIMLPTSLKPNQYVEFELDPALWYGYGSSSNCGLISSNLPMTIEDYYTSDLTVRCGGSKKNWFSGSTTVEKNDRIYFQFVFMYKNSNGRWEQSTSPSNKFYVEFKYANTDDGAGNIQKWIIGFRAKLA